MGNSRTVGEYQQGGGGGNRSPADSDDSDGGDSSRDAEREIEESHQEYAEDAQITDKQAKDMQERRENVVDNLKDEGLSIEEDHIYGSVMQGTMTGPLDEDCDVDVLVVLDADEHGQWATSRNGPQNALRAVKRRLKRKYPNQEVRIDRNVVAVKFSDFTVEVTPAFRYNDTRPCLDAPQPASHGPLRLI
ncbi:SMODS domain-containing nucleotidyltransferase [Halomicrobium katesii]|uniref:SMODS domain-containing nucleotidyltransferase n=1 Tax=Halomicrobium katesii TaxID=437163 RepID=UPI001B7FD27D|nr:hypothetical protein [Halomicrobium katesii]